MTLALALIVVVAATAIAVAAMLALRRVAPPGGAFSDSDRASSVFGLLGVAVAIFLGFVIVLAFGDFDKAKQDGETEAETTLQQFENAHLFGPTAGRALEGQLICCGRAVVERGWPRMERNAGASPVVDLWGLRLARTSEAAPLAGAKGQAAYGDGDGTIKPTAMRHALTVMQGQYAGRPPCTADGAPV